MATRDIRLKIITVGVGMVISVTLSACGGGNGPSAEAPATPPSSAAAAPSPAHNQADVAFAQQMIPHHQQAIEMAQMASGQDASAQVRDLAHTIEAGQQPEIDQMTSFLRAWNVSSPPSTPRSGDMPTMSNMPNMDQGHGDTGTMPGMMSSTQMHQMTQARGTAFDTLFLQMMIQHHQGAITMATTELANGQNPEAKALAQRIINAQKREITDMHELLSNR